jgi:glycerophosphoryl diester phosphodiesterase
MGFLNEERSSTMKKMMPSLLTGALLLCLSATDANAGCFNPKQVIDTMKTTVGKSYKPIIAAHRGLWAKENGNNHPENSLAALKAADKACIEAVELDVKESSDGVVFLMHDYHLGRTTNINDVIGGSKYNPETDSGVNPKAIDTPWATIDSLKLLSPDRNEVTSQEVSSIAQVYDYYYDQRMSTVLVFDIKTKQSALKIAELLAKDTRDYGNGLKAVDFTIFKLNAPIYPFPDAFSNDLSSRSIDIQPKVMAIYTTNMLQEFADKGWNIADSLKAWVARDGVVEVNLKQTGGLLSDLVDISHINNAALGVFNAVPDYNGPGPIPGGIPANKAFYNNTGSCCYQLSDKFATFDGVSDTNDRRGDRTFLYGPNSQRFSFITTDLPLSVISDLKSKNLRDTSLYGGPQANVAVLAWNGEHGSTLWAGGPVCLFDNPFTTHYGWMYSCVNAHPYTNGYTAQIVLDVLEPTPDGQFASEAGIKMKIKDKNGQCLNYNLDTEATNYSSDCDTVFSTWLRTKDRMIRSAANDGFCLASQRGGIFWGNEYGTTSVKGCDIQDIWQKWVFTKDAWTYDPL